MIFCIWYAWPVLASGERFFEMICSCVKNCDTIISTTSVERMPTVSCQPVACASQAPMSVSCRDATPKSFAL